jgi:hypothetical protein
MKKRKPKKAHSLTKQMIAKGYTRKELLALFKLVKRIKNDSKKYFTAID